MNAGEQVTKSAMKAFIEATSVFGVSHNAIQPAYGMAELSTCVTYNNNFSLDEVSNEKSQARPAPFPARFFKAVAM